MLQSTTNELKGLVLSSIDNILFSKKETSFEFSAGIMPKKSLSFNYFGAVRA